MLWTSQAARWRVRTGRGLKNNHLADVATSGAFFRVFFLASIFQLEVACFHCSKTFSLFPFLAKTGFLLGSCWHFFGSFFQVFFLTSSLQVFSSILVGFGGQNGSQNRFLERFLGCFLGTLILERFFDAFLCCFQCSTS